MYLQTFQRPPWAKKLHGTLWIFTDRVRSTTGRLCFDSCLSFCLSTPGGYPSQVQWGVPWPGGTHLRYPCWMWLGGYPDGGVPHLGYYLHQTWPGVLRWGSTPPQVPPCQTWLGGTLMGGLPHLRYPPVRPGWGVYPNSGYPGRGYPTSGTSCQIWLGGQYPNGGVPHLGNTWYAIVDMPLAFMQEDFLVYGWLDTTCLFVLMNHLIYPELFIAF